MKFGMSTALTALALASGLGLGTTGANAADDPAAFFHGRQLTITLGFGAGGGYANYCRQLVAYWPKHIPGQPTVVCQYMPGGGGVKAANYRYNVAPRDGSMLSLLSAGSATTPVLEPEKVKYDAAKLSWLGGFGDAVARGLRDTDTATPVRTFGLPQRFLEHGERGEVLAEAGLTPQQLARAVTEAVARLTADLVPDRQD